MEIKRDRYLNKLISFMWDGQVKVITGIRRCGKSYLLRNLFRTYLLGEGVPADHILSFELDLTRDIRYRNPLELANRVREIVENQREQFYLFVDEIQMSDEVPNPYNPDGKKITFYDALNDLKSLPNLDIYVTGPQTSSPSSGGAATRSGCIRSALRSITPPWAGTRRTLLKITPSTAGCR